MTTTKTTITLNPSQKIKGIVQNTFHSPHQIRASNQEHLQKNYSTQDSIPNDRVLFQSILEHSEPIPKSTDSEAHHNSPVIASVLKYCLNTQSKMADALAEIGSYLKELDEKPVSTPSSQKQTYVPKTYLNYSLSSTSTTKARETVSKKSSIELILSKLEDLKKEITAKICDFENTLSSSKTNLSAKMVDLNSQLDEFPETVSPKQPLSQIQQVQAPAQKISDKKYAIKASYAENIAFPYKSLTPKADFNKLCNDQTNEFFNSDKVQFSALLRH